MSPEIADTLLVETPQQAVALLNPLRAEILSYTTEPASAAEIARSMNDTAQRINYHIKALEKAGLVRRTGTRQVRNLVEVLYQAVARTFVLAESLGMNAEAVQHMKDQGSLSHLITVSERIKQDALRLMRQSDEGTQIPSASLHTKLHLPDETRRQAFVEEYVRLVSKLAEKYGARETADPIYHLLLAIYPDSTEGGAT